MLFKIETKPKYYNRKIKQSLEEYRKETKKKLNKMDRKNGGKRKLSTKCHTQSNITTATAKAPPIVNLKDVPSPANGEN